MSRSALIDQLQQAGETLEKLPTMLQSTPVATDLSLTSIRLDGNADEPAKLPGSPASKSRGMSSEPSGLPRAWALRANFCNGDTCCGSAMIPATFPALAIQYDLDLRQCLRTSSAVLFSFQWF
jgi:hypothetical protein